jgi:hypothetical protein
MAKNVSAENWLQTLTIISPKGVVLNYVTKFQTESPSAKVATYSEFIWETLPSGKRLLLYGAKSGKTNLSESINNLKKRRIILS